MTAEVQAGEVKIFDADGNDITETVVVEIDYRRPMEYKIIDPDGNVVKDEFLKIGVEYKAVRKKAYICCPIGGPNIKQNLNAARVYCKYALDMGYIPVCPPLMFLQFMDEDDDRDMGLAMALGLMLDCDQLIVFKEPLTSGMVEEVKVWTREKESEIIKVNIPPTEFCDLWMGMSGLLEGRD